MPSSTTRRLKAIGGAGLLAAGLLAGFAAPASAGTGAPTVSDTSVMPGASIDVSGYCYLEPEESGTAGIALVEGWLGPDGHPTTSPVVGYSNLPIDPAGQWSQTMVIPDDTAPGAYTLYSACYTGSGPIRFVNVEITVEAPPADTTTTTSTSTTMLTTTTTAPAATGPAHAVRATPTYTG